MGWYFFASVVVVVVHSSIFAPTRAVDFDDQGLRHKNTASCELYHHDHPIRSVIIRGPLHGLCLAPSCTQDGRSGNVIAVAVAIAIVVG